MTIVVRYIILTALALSVMVPYRSAQASIEQDAVCKLDAKKRIEFKQKYPQFAAVECPGDATPAAAAQNKPPKPIKTAAAPKPNPPSDQSGDYRTNFLLRNSWSDLGWLGGACMQSVSGVSAAGSKGATLSFERDYANNNKIWTVQGMAAGVVSYCPNAGYTSDYTGLLGQSLAVYGQANTIYDSNPLFAKKNNNDTRTAGLVGEEAYSHNGDVNVFRVAPNVVFDNINNTTAVAVMAQYAPAWIQTFGRYLWEATPIYKNGPGFQFNPVFDLQYTSAMEHSKPLQFNGRDQSLRLGPELTFILTPYSSGSNFWDAIGFSETFHPWLEVYNTRSSSYWWDNSIFYDLTDNLAVKLSYDRGLDQNSGIMTNQYILSLAGKI